MSQLRLGLAGAGRFGQLHAAVLSALPNVTLAAIADPCTERCHHVADRHQVARRYGSTQELFDDADLDAFVLVTPDEQHGAQGLAAVATGKPVFIEKPLASSSHQAMALQKAAAASGSLLQTGLLLRYELQHALLQEELAAGHFGELVSIRVKRNLSAAWFSAVADRAHTVYESLIHDLDLLLWLSGSRATRVMAMERRFGTHQSPEGCYALIELASGCVAMAETSWFVPPQAPANVMTETWAGTIDAELAVVGTQQTAQLRLLDSPLTIWGQDHQRHPDAQLWPLHQGHIHGALERELADFTNAARTGIPSRTASLDQAIEGLQLAEAIVEATRTGQAVAMPRMVADPQS
jgi:predicted dehydrogenase